MDVPKVLPGNLEGTRLMLRAAIPLLCVLVALTAAGCGESGSGGEGDPASLVPAGAAFYLQGSVQPQGERREDALAAASKIMRTDDPAAKLRELIDKELADEGLQWERDFASWLGEDVGFWVTNFEAEEPSWAAIVASKDTEAAKAVEARVEKASDMTYTARSYDGIDYKVYEDGMAGGYIDDFVVVGTEDAFKRTVDTRDGDSLADDDRYGDAIGELEEERLGHYYLDIKPLLEAAKKQDPATAVELRQFEGMFPFDKLRPVTGAFTADGDGMTLDTIVTGIPEGPFRNLAQMWAGGETELLGELPGDAWGAFATPKLGEAAESLVSSFAGAIGGAALAAQVKQATGLDLQEDVFSWIGDVGVFVRGADMASIDGALVIGSTDDERASAAFGKIIAVIGRQAGTQPEPVQVDGAESAFAFAAPGAEKRIVLARGAEKVVAAYGEDAAAAALSSDAKLADSESFGAAREILGDDMEPAFLLSIEDAIALADAVGETDAEFEKARPYLEALGVVTSGGSVDGDRVQSRVAVTLK
jgi:Protein of unknown function (DUF3352)